MTTGTTAELVPALERGLDAIERRDMDAMVASVGERLDPACEFVPALGEAVEGPSTYRGAEGVRAYFSGLFDAFSRMRYDDREFRVIGERAILFLAQFEAQGSASGAVLTTEMAALFECSDGAIHRVTSFTAHDEAVAAAEGLLA